MKTWFRILSLNLLTVAEINPKDLTAQQKSLCSLAKVALGNRITCDYFVD